MKKKKSKAPVAKATPLASLVEQVRALVQSARLSAAVAVNTLQVLTNFEIGRLVVEHEQQGSSRAAYGAQLLKDLAEHLTAEFGRGFSRSNLQSMRSFFLVYRDRLPHICQKPSGKLPTAATGTVASAGAAPQLVSSLPTNCRRRPRCFPGNAPTRSSSAGHTTSYC